MNWSRRLFLVLGLIGFTGSAANAADDAVARFYDGKLLRLIIGSPAGGAIDQLVRAVGRHMVNHIPGKPTFIPVNMDGAGSRVAANWLYNVAPRDGTTIGNVTQGTALDQARKESGIQFDVAKFNWLGNPLLVNDVLISWTQSGLLTIDDVLSKGGLLCGGSASSSPSVINPRMLKMLTGADIKIILGYPGNNDRMIAMERGELNCIGGTNLDSASVLFGPQLEAHKISVLVQYGTDEDRGISKFAGHRVPLILSFAHDDTDRAALKLINSGVTFGRPLLAPPGVPEERVEALRRAFDETMHDADFLADAERQKLKIHPVSGERLQLLATDIAGAQDVIVSRANELVGAQP